MLALQPAVARSSPLPVTGTRPLGRDDGRRSMMRRQEQRAQSAAAQAGAGRDGHEGAAGAGEGRCPRRDPARSRRREASILDERAPVTNQAPVSQPPSTGPAEAAPSAPRSESTATAGRAAARRARPPRRVPAAGGVAARAAATLDDRPGGAQRHRLEPADDRPARAARGRAGGCELDHEANMRRIEEKLQSFAHPGQGREVATRARS